jgi:hypothetical protein
MDAPVPVEVVEVVDAVGPWGLLAGVALVAMLVVAVYFSARYRPEAMLVIVLGVIAITGVMGYLIGGESRAELVTIAAAAVGALAGALTILANIAGQKDPGPFEYPHEDEVDSIEPTEDTPDNTTEDE